MSDHILPLTQDCEDLTYAQVAPGLQNPLTDPSLFLNTLYEQPADDGAYKIRPVIFFGADELDYGFHYVGKSLNINDPYAFEASICKWTYVNNDSEKPNVPLKGLPPKNIRCIVYNEDRSRVIFNGYIIDSKKQVRWRDGDGVTSQIVEDELVNVTLKDYFTFQAKRFLIFDIYENVTTFFIMKDTINRHMKGVDGSSIDSSKGITITRWNINGLKPDEIIRRCLELEGNITIKFDHENESASIVEVGSTGTVILSLDETNVYDRMIRKDQFYLSKSEKMPNNTIFFYYIKKLNLQCNFTNGSNAVAVNTTGGNPVADMNEIKLDGGHTVHLNSPEDDGQYTISKIVGTSDFRISPAWEGATTVPAAGDAATITGAPGRHIATNIDHMETMANILGETGQTNAGVFHVKFKKSDPMTDDEAWDYANAWLDRYTQSSIKDGKLITRNLTCLQGQTIPRAGDCVNFNLPISWVISEIGVIKNVNIRDTGAALADVDTDPELEYTFSFLDRLQVIDNQLERAYRDIKDTVIIGDDIITVFINMPELIVLNDCVTPTPPVEPEEDCLELDDVPLILTFDPATDWRTTTPAGTTPVGVPSYTWSLTTNSLTAP